MAVLSSYAPFDGHVPMLSSSALPRREHEKEHVFSLTSLSEPEPNRLLSVQKSAVLSPKSRPSSPPPGAPSPNQRITQTQHAVARRKLAQFMNSILTRPLPLCVFSPQQISPILALDAHIAPFSASQPSTQDVVSCLEALLMSPNEAQSLESEQCFDAESESLFARQDGSSAHSCHSSVVTSSEAQLYQGEALSWDVGSRVEKCSDLEASSSLTELPNEILLAILGFFSEKQDLLGASRVCKMFRNVALAESLWKPSLVSIASRCGIPNNLLLRDDDIPSYLRWSAINRWSQRYEEAHNLLLKLAPENRSSVEEKEQFETLFEGMMPNVSPWLPSAYSIDEITVKLPISISVIPLNDLATVQVFIELASGAHRHELISKGLSPALEFVIYNPCSPKPTIYCKTNDIYHPMLEQTSKQLSLPPSYYQHEYSNADSSTKIRLLVLAIQECFTRLDSIASDFTL